MKKKIRILITGSKGFVGKNLAKYLKNIKNFIILTDNKKKFDLSKLNQFKKLLILSNPNIIIHLASRTKSGISSLNEDKLQKKNTYMPVVNLIKNLQHCKNLQRIIFAGSIEEYGKARYPYKENSIPRPISSYGRYKYKSYKYVKKKLINNRIEYVWLRPSLMFGPKDNSQRFLGTILSGLKNKEVFKISLGKQMRDFLFVEDFNKFIHLHLIKKKFVKLKLVNLSNENWLSLKFIINKINLLSKVDIEKYLHIKKIADDSKLINSGLLLKKNYPRFKFTNFFYALKKTIKSYRI